jgi:hypothetical protein
MNILALITSLNLHIASPLTILNQEQNEKQRTKR